MRKLLVICTICPNKKRKKMAIHTLTDGERYKIGKVNNTAVILESTDEAGSAYTLRPTQFICETSASVKINLQGSNNSIAPVLWLDNTFNGTHSDCFIRFDSLVGAYAWVAGGDSSTDSFVIDRSTVVNSSAPSFIISGSTENVGLGTNKPTSKLHVVGTGNITSDTTIGGTLFCTKINTFDTDTLVEIGRTHVGSVGHGDCAGFSHIDQNSTTNYALLQSSVGNTFLNAASGKKVYFRINNSDIATLSTTGLGIGDSSPSYQLELSTNSAGKPTSNTWTVTSDERIKENIQLADLDRCYDIVKNLPLKHYKWREDVYSTKQIEDRHALGWIAQDVKSVFPKAVNSREFKYNKKYEDTVIPAVFDENGIEIEKERTSSKLISEDIIKDCLDLDSGQIIASLYGAVQKLIAKVEALENK
jgi:hypothetical protein